MFCELAASTADYEYPLAWATYWSSSGVRYYLAKWQTISCLGQKGYASLPTLITFYQSSTSYRLGKQQILIYRWYTNFFLQKYLVCPTRWRQLKKVLLSITCPQHSLCPQNYASSSEASFSVMGHPLKLCHDHWWWWLFPHFQGFRENVWAPKKNANHGYEVLP